MILGTGHHHPAAAHGLAAGASTAAMPMSSESLYGSAVPSQQGYHSAVVAALIPSSTLAVELDAAQEMTTNNKRKREEQSPAFGAAQAQPQPIVIDRSLHNEAERFCNTLEEEMRRQETLMLSTVEAMVEKRLLAKDQEIMHNWGVNCALGERLKTLYMEAEAWRIDAQSKQTEANVLRADLERALAQQAVRYRGSGSGEGEGEDDAESCCWGDYHVAFCRGEELETPVVEPPVTGAGMCNGCGENAPVVVLLPCRHLSVCGPCAEVAVGCPSCGCTKQSSIYINFS